MMASKKFSIRNISSYKWTSFTIERIDEDEFYDMTIYHKVGQDGALIGKIYYCANSIALMLGFEESDEFIDNIPEENFIDIPDYLGFFMDEATIRKHVPNGHWVLQWLDSYNCNEQQTED